MSAGAVVATAEAVLPAGQRENPVMEASSSIDRAHTTNNAMVSSSDNSWAEMSPPRLPGPLLSPSETMRPLENRSAAPVAASPAEEKASYPPNAEAGPSTPPTPAPAKAYPQPQPPSSSKSKSVPLTLSAHLIKHPEDSVGRAIGVQFPRPNPIKRLFLRVKIKHSIIKGMKEDEMRKLDQKEGEMLRRRAGWKLPGEEGPGAEVSDLFWKMYLSLRPTVVRDPLAGLVPPDLLGSTTTMPLSIISLIPDIMQHYHDVIIRAKEEIFLATNYWQPSNSVNTVSQSLRDLSALVIKENRKKVVVKIMYDRGSFEQLWNAHAFVKPEGWTPLDLPSIEDIPGLEMEVINFHRVLLGTFHAKFLIVDRKVALINSNNIQDRPNLELMSHLEGPVVDAFYEVALHSWYNRLTPPLPCMTKPYEPPRDANGRVRYLFSDHNPYFDEIEVLKAAKAARLLLRKQTRDHDEEKARAGDHPERFRDVVRKKMDQQSQRWEDWRPGEELNARAQNAMQELREFRDRWAAGMMGQTSRAGSRANSRPGSRSNSRGPSRRTSTTDVAKLQRYTDPQTAGNTAANASLIVDPSEAPSSPTMVDSFVSHQPPKAKTLPASGHDDDPSAHERTEHPVAGASAEKPHVMFAAQDADELAHHNEANRGRAPGLRQAPDSPRSAMRPSRTATPRFDASLAGSHFAEGTVTASPSASVIHLPPRLDIPSRPMTPNGDSPNDRYDDGDHFSIPDELHRTHTIRWNKVGGTKLVRADSDVPPEWEGSKRLYQMSKMFNAAGVLSEAWANVEDSDDLDNFRPHVVHKPHEPFPIAMVCRKPHGFPGHHDIRNPQNAAWLAGFRYAKHKVFVQTPTLNARPIVRAVKQACRRGVTVVLLLDLGFNDKGESIPFQGGTNEEVVDRLYKILCKEKKEQFLKVYWYTGKDQVRPLNAVKKQRNCHIKFAAYDDEVMIIGNGNQDSQSWFHSQEINVMIDNKQVIAEMMETLLGNQNTMQYGLVDTDGQWRDKEGKTLKDYGATGGGAFRGLSAFITFAKAI